MINNPCWKQQSLLAVFLLTHTYAGLERDASWDILGRKALMLKVGDIQENGFRVISSWQAERKNTKHR